MATKTHGRVPAELREARSPQNIGKRLKLLREAHGLSSSQIADMLDIERTYWSRFERGSRPVSNDVATLLVARFGVTLDFLILGRWDRLPLELAESMRSIEAKNS